MGTFQNVVFLHFEKHFIMPLTYFVADICVQMNQMIVSKCLTVCISFMNNFCSVCSCLIRVLTVHFTGYVACVCG